jgi:hypothetical protein
MNELDIKEECFARQGFAEVRRLVRMETFRPQLPAEKAAESGFKVTSIVVACLTDLLAREPTAFPKNAQEHEAALNQSALGATATCPVHAERCMDHLIMQVQIKTFCEDLEGGGGAIEFVMPVVSVNACLDKFLAVQLPLL